MIQQQPISTLERKRAYDRQWRIENAERKRAYDREYDRAHPRSNHQTPSVVANRAFILAAKDRPCVDCGSQYAPDEMHFDHVRGEKLFALGGNAARRSRVAIEAELAKCEVRCLVCHGKRHGGRPENLRRQVGAHEFE